MLFFYTIICSFLVFGFTCNKVHYFACFGLVRSAQLHPALARFRPSRATALKPTHEAGRRGGDSIARRHVFNYQNRRRQRVVVAFCFAGIYEKAGRGGRGGRLVAGIKRPPIRRPVYHSSSFSRLYFLNRMTSTPTQSFTSLMRCWSGVSSLRTNTFAAFSTSPTDPTFSGLPPIS